MANNIDEAKGLEHAHLVGWTIVRCDGQKCETCLAESYDCKKLTMPGGQICLWE